MDRSHKTTNQSYGAFYRDGLGASSYQPSRVTYIEDDTLNPYKRSHEEYSNNYYSRQTGTYNPFESKHREESMYNINDPYSRHSSEIYDSKYYQKTTSKSNYSSGLPNLGNTCYM